MTTTTAAATATMTTTTTVATQQTVNSEAKIACELVLTFAFYLQCATARKGTQKRKILRVLWVWHATLRIRHVVHPLSESDCDYACACLYISLLKYA